MPIDKIRKKKIYPFVRKKADGNRLKTTYSFYRQHSVFVDNSTGSLGPGLPPLLSSLNYTLADSAGGDSVTIAGSNLSSALSCAVGGTSATITANVAGSLTFTMPAKIAGSYNVQVTTAAGTSNTLTIEAWAPTDDATCTLLMDAKSNPYDAIAGTWIPRYTSVVGQALINTGGSGNHPSDGAGGVVMDGNGLVEAGLATSTGSLSSYFGTAVGGYQAGSYVAVFSSQNTKTDTLTNYNASPYVSTNGMGNMTQGTTGVGAIIFSDDGLHRIVCHQYGAPYKGLKVITPAGSAFRSVISRWHFDTSLSFDLSVDGALSGGLFASDPTAIGGNTAFLNQPLTIGTLYSGNSAANQQFIGTWKCIALLNARASDTFVTKFNAWKLARFGV